jgi:hypothetical protein
MTKLSELLGRLLEARKRFQIAVPKAHSKKAETVLGIAPSGTTNGDVTFDYPSPMAGKIALDALRDAGISGKTLGWTELDERVDEELTRRYYVALAGILRPYSRERVGQDIIRDIADFFSLDNPRFDRERFLRAAGVAVREPEPVPAEEEVPVAEELTPREIGRIRHLGEGVWDYVFDMLDAEPDWGGELAGKVAAAAEKAFVETLTKELEA